MSCTFWNQRRRIAAAKEKEAAEKKVAEKQEKKTGTKKTGATKHDKRTGGTA